MKSVGPFKEIKMNINGLTVLRGPSNSGKTRICKMLHILLQASKLNWEGYIKDRIKHVIATTLLSAFPLYEEIPEQLIERLFYMYTSPELHDGKDVMDTIADFTPVLITEMIKLLKELEEMCNSCPKSMSDMLYSYFVDEHPIRNLNQKRTAIPTLSLKGNDINIEVSFDNDDLVGNVKNTSKNRARRSFYLGNLKGFRMFEKFDGNYQYPKQIKDLIDDIYSGARIEYHDNNIYYHQSKGAKPISWNNLSSGLKAILLLEIAYQNIQQGDTLILDNLDGMIHPEYQIYFAKLVVLIQIYKKVNILLTTNSPYTLEAVKGYSKKYGNDLSLYKTERNDKHCNLINASNTSQIYDDMFTPMQTIEDIKWDYILGRRKEI